MTRMPALTRFCLNSGRTLLPWIATLAVSATVAHAVTGSVLSSSSDSVARTDLEIVVPTGGPSGIAPFELLPASLSVAVTESSFARLAEPCAASDAVPMHVGVDAWIVAENHTFGCR